MTKDEIEWVDEVWTYLGIRLNTKGQRRAAWMDPKGTTLYYAPVAGQTPVIGGLYDVQVQRDGGRVTRKVPVYTGRTTDLADQVADWTAAHHVAQVQLARQRRESNDAKADALDRAIQPLIDIAQTLRTGADRDALAAYIIRRVGSSW
jgi:hypothetical protein